MALTKITKSVIEDTGVTAGTYGAAASVPVLTINEQGQITAASTTAVAGVDSVAYDTSTGVLTINTSDGGSFTEDLGVGTSDSPTFVDLTVDSIQLTGGTGDQGTLSWNADEETLDLVQNNTTLQLGQEIHIHVRNGTGSTISNGTVVMATGTLGASGRIVVAPYDGVSDIMYVIGVATEDIAAGADGKATSFGKVRGINTSTYSEGDVLYTTTNGGLTTTQPTSGIANAIAFVISSKSNGTIMVRFTPHNIITDFHAETAYGWGDHGQEGYATESYVGTAISNLVDSAPGTLDTLNELAAALGDDANFASTVTNSLATKVDKINITGATVGSGTAIPVITYNSQGQITSATTASIPPITKATIDALNVDADTLDGLNSTQFLRSDTSDTMAGDLDVTGTVTATSFYGSEDVVTELYEVQTDTNPNVSTNDFFGRDHDINDKYLVTGNQYSLDGIGGTAKVYDSTTGELLYTMYDPDGKSEFGNFGMAVKLSGDYMIVGAPMDADSTGTYSMAGAAYIYDLTDGSLAYTLDNPSQALTWFGTSVDIEGNYAIVGAMTYTDGSGNSSAGRAYIYDVTTGNLLHTLENPNADGTAANDNFGMTVRLSGTYAFVNSYDENTAGDNNSGKVYIFNVATGSLVRTIDNPTPYGTGADDYFSGDGSPFPPQGAPQTLAAYGNYLAVGAPFEDDAGGSTSGKLYLYDITNGALVRTFDNPNLGNGSTDNQKFGFHVTMDDKWIITGTLDTVYVYDYNGNILTSWASDITTYEHQQRTSVYNDTIVYRAGQPGYLSLIAIKYGPLDYGYAINKKAPKKDPIFTGNVTVDGGNVIVDGGNVIVDGGNVGIGTTIPGVLLHLKKSSGAPILRLEAPASELARIELGDGSNYAHISSRPDMSDGLMFYENGAANTVMRGGNVGIGDTTPSYKLDVNGTIRATGDVIADSDRRLKSEIKPITNAVDTVKALSGKSYIKDDKPNIGLIAQEVEEVMPFMVHTASDEMGTKSVNYQNMVALLIEAVKEQQEQIDELKRMLESK
jgi:hypothetical protein